MDELCGEVRYGPFPVDVSNLHRSVRIDTERYFKLLGNRVLPQLEDISCLPFLSSYRLKQTRIPPSKNFSLIETKSQL
jgi:hypothetical protein